jgi:uncharacterized repeat protein (TIGR03803 family)
VFKLTPAGVETLLHSFGAGTDGTLPKSNLIQASDGNFYGTTYSGGTVGAGTIFKITPAGIETVLYSFGSGTDGANPQASLIQASDGNFYGTTSGGGANNFGTVFKVTPAGVESVLYSFRAGTDGATPQASLIQASDGNFYGTTYSSGNNVGSGVSLGTVFKVTPAGVETILHSFGGEPDGAGPVASLIQTSDGNFYGTTTAGGSHGQGTVFKITPLGVETLLHSFGLPTDGAIPQAGLIKASDGNFYGTTSSYGLGMGAISGTAFKITPAGDESILHSFGASADGSTPRAGLIQASDGNFYGTTAFGGGPTIAGGVVFELIP